MACFKQYLYATAAVATCAAGGAGIAASGVIEAGSVGALTPVALATLIGGVATLIAGLAACIATGIDLAECYEAAGKTEEAAKIRARVSGLQAEHDRLVALKDKLQALVTT
jgi:hypothetical protein